jgi:hypothetical protein
MLLPLKYLNLPACSEEESDDEDDDEEELQAELQRIKAEREQAQARKLQEDMEIEQRLKRDSAMKGNPLAMIEENSAKVSCLCIMAPAHHMCRLRVFAVSH